jgi:hypothetical protein
MGVALQLRGGAPVSRMGWLLLYACAVAFAIGWMIGEYIHK